MLHKSASAADTVVQRDLNAPPPVQVVTVLPPGSRPSLPPPPGSSEGAAPRRHPSNGPSGLAAAGGVFAGVSMVAAGSLVALGLVCSVAIYLLITASPSAPGTVEVAPPSPVTEADIERAAAEANAPPPAPAPAPTAPTAPAATAPAPVEPSGPRPGESALITELRTEGIRFPAEFAFNDWRPLGTDVAAVDDLVAKIQQCPDRIRVTGHTDQKGTDLTNDTFALARAGEVRRILGQKGIDKRRIEVSSSGPNDPEADVKTPEGRAFNRRVVVRCY
jgi:outer membrane protein OmpA-like peptidoglycan-associated protein